MANQFPQGADCSQSAFTFGTAMSFRSRFAALFARVTAPTCEDCGSFFDPRDEHALVSERVCLCGRCNTFVLAHRDYAVWNGCQGVFTPATSFDEAVERLHGELEGVGTCVVPVFTVVAPDDALYHFDRLCSDRRTREHLWRKQCEAQEVERDVRGSRSITPDHEDTLIEAGRKAVDDLLARTHVARTGHFNAPRIGA